MIGVGHAAEADTDDTVTIHRGGRGLAVASVNTGGDNTRHIVGRAVGHQTKGVGGVGGQAADSVGVTVDAGGHHTAVIHIINSIGGIAVVVNPSEGGSGGSESAAHEVGGHNAAGRSGERNGSHEGAVVCGAVGIDSEGVGSLGSEVVHRQVAGSDARVDDGAVSQIDDGVGGSIVVVAPVQSGAGGGDVGDCKVDGLVASGQVATLQSHAHTVLIVCLGAREGCFVHRVVASERVGVLAVAVPCDGLVTSAGGGAELVGVAIVVATVVVDDNHQVAVAVEKIRRGQRDVVPALAEIHRVVENLHGHGGVEQVNVAAVGKHRLGGRLQPDGDIELVGHGRGIHVVVAEGVDKHRAANLLSRDDGLAERVFVVVVDRGVVTVAGAVARSPSGGHARGCGNAHFNVVDKPVPGSAVGIVAHGYLGIGRNRGKVNHTVLHGGEVVV